MLGNEREPVAVGDVLMTVFGRGGGQGEDAGGESMAALRSKQAFVELCRQLPFISVQVYRDSLVAEHIATSENAMELRKKAEKAASEAAHAR